ncbi:MAG: TolC family protein [Lentimicrobiaceae bacterium]|nr:TolC family protein [Lentimicrobiaceae bacterium]
MKFFYFKALLFFLTAFSLSSFVYAQETKPTPLALSLKQAQAYALEHNTSVKNSRIDLELAQKKIWETLSIGLPQITAKANYQHLFKVPELSLGGSTFLATDLPPGTVITSTDILNENVYMGFRAGQPIPLGVKDNLVFDFTLSQLIFSGEYLVGVQASKVYYLLSDQAKTKTNLDIRESVANTYSLVLVLEQSRNTLEQSLSNLIATLNEMRSMYEQGFIENTDVDQMELNSLNLTNSLNSMQRQVEATHDLLKFQMGMPYENTIVLTDSLESITGEVTIETLTANRFHLNQNINYQMMETQEKLSTFSLKREKSSYLPTLAAVYQHTEKLNKPEFDFAPKDLIALSLNFPLFTSGQRNSKVQQRKLELEKVVNNKANVASGLQLEYETSLNELTTAWETWLNNKKNIELTRRIYDKTLIKYKEGISSSLDLTNAQNQYLTALGNYYNANYALITAKNKLDKLTNNL